MSFLSARILYFSICGATYLQIEKKRSFIEVSAIYIYTKLTFCKKPRVSATSWIFEYYISNIKKQKLKKLRENWNSFHNLVLLVGFFIFHVLVCQLVGQKKWKKGTSVFYLQDRDYNGSVWLARWNAPRHTDKNDNVLTSMVDKVDLQKAINVDSVSVTDLSCGFDASASWCRLQGGHTCPAGPILIISPSKSEEGWSCRMVLVADARDQDALHDIGALRCCW